VLETFDLLERTSGGHEFVGALIWPNGSAECAVVNFADGCSSLDLGPDLGPQNHFSLGSYWAVRQSHGVLLSLVATVDDVEFRHELTPSQNSYAHPEFSARPPPARGSLWSALSGCVGSLSSNWHGSAFVPIDAHWINTLCHSILLYWVSRASRGEISDVRIFVRNWNKTSAVGVDGRLERGLVYWLERRGAIFEGDFVCTSLRSFKALPLPAFSLVASRLPSNRAKMPSCP
jgi:hypothetical protein